MDKDYRADVVIGQDDADEPEYPTCYQCGSPIVLFVHTDALGYSRTCSNPECSDGLEKFCAQQIPGTVIQHCIDAEGVESLREQLTAKLGMLNDYREENGLDPVDIPAAPA